MQKDLRENKGGVNVSPTFGVSLNVSRDNQSVFFSIPSGYVEMNKQQLIALNYTCAKNSSYDVVGITVKIIV